MTPCILGIESSCDETGASVISLEGQVLSNVVQVQHDVHGRYGGVVPELASRRHIEKIEFVVHEALRAASVGWPEIRAIAVTRGPGLAGSLVVGVSFGKSLAYALNIPWIAVNHLEGHLASAGLDNPDFAVPSIVLVVSGGHTHLYDVSEWGHYQLLGRTLDDAAGEAFDKGAAMLGLPYPGGPALDRLAKSGDPGMFHFPRPYHQKGGLDFSFSGIKTSLLYYLRDRPTERERGKVEDIAASYQEAIVDVLIDKSLRALHQNQRKNLAVVGGVSANSRLREVLGDRAGEAGIQLTLPHLEYCTDNAAMIAAAGLHLYRLGRFASWEWDVEPALPVGALS